MPHENLDLKVQLYAKTLSLLPGLKNILRFFYALPSPPPGKTGGKHTQFLAVIP
jgi:hypothetical protein